MKCLYNTHQPNLETASHIRKNGISIHQYTCIKCGSKTVIKRSPASIENITKIEDLPRVHFKKFFVSINCDKIEIFYEDKNKDRSAMEIITGK